MIYYGSNEATPFAIVCPKDADEVSAIIRLAITHKLPFTVRSGGHECHGRNIIQDALCIDMRSINFVKVSSDRTTAKIGGGILIGDLEKALSSKGLVTPFGSVPTVGYVGWATLGGYGSLSSQWGLGVDQIVEAEVVNDVGAITQATPETLRGIRGGGGNFGVIVSLRIRIYNLKNVSERNPGRIGEVSNMMCGRIASCRASRIGHKH